MKFFQSIVVASIALFSSIASMAATPASLSFSGGQVSTLVGIGFDTGSWLSGIASTYDLSAMQMGGKLNLNSKSELTYTFVGGEASYNNFFRASGGSNTFTNEGSAPGTSFQIKDNGKGALDFGFKSNDTGKLFKNGSKSIGVVLAKDEMSALILFNDSYSTSKKSEAGDSDFDDMVVRVAVFPELTVSPVPEPETYAMLLAGLGLVSAIARRRNKAKPA